MDPTDLRTLLEALSSGPDPQRTLADFLQRLMHPSGSEPSSEKSAIAVPVNLSITLAPASKETLERVEKESGVAGELPISVAPDVLTPELIAAIEKANPVVLQALAEPSLAALFAANPLAALRQIAHQLDPAFLRLLEAAYTQAAKPPPPAGLRLRQVTVQVRAS